MDEDTVLKTAERNGFGGSIPFSSATNLVLQFNGLESITTDDKMPVQIGLGLQTIGG